MLLTPAEIRGDGTSTRIGRLQAANVVILDVVRRHCQRGGISHCSPGTSQLPNESTHFEAKNMQTLEAHAKAPGTKIVEDVNPVAKRQTATGKAVPPIQFEERNCDVNGGDSVKRIHGVRAAPIKPEARQPQRFGESGEKENVPYFAVQQAGDGLNSTPIRQSTEIGHVTPKGTEILDQNAARDSSGCAVGTIVASQKYKIGSNETEAGPEGMSKALETSGEVEAVPHCVPLVEEYAQFLKPCVDANETQLRQWVQTSGNAGSDDEDGDSKYSLEESYDQSTSFCEQQQQDTFVSEESRVVSVCGSAAGQSGRNTNPSARPFAKSEIETTSEKSNAGLSIADADQTNSESDKKKIIPISGVNCAASGPWASYSLDRLLGEGAYGAVYSATHVKRGTKHAVKKFKLTADGDEEDEEMANYAVTTAQRELKVLQCIGSHSNIVAFNEAWSEEASVMNGTVIVTAPVLVFEMLSMTALEALDLQETAGFSSEVCFSLLRDLCAAIEHIHSLNIVHRDVKPENVLLTQAPSTHEGAPPPILKLCDFGAARRLEDTEADSSFAGDLTHYIGSRWYRAPEMMAGCTEYGLKVDIWGAACIMAEFASGQPLFPGEDEVSVLVRIIDVVGEFPASLVANLSKHGVPSKALHAQPAYPGRLEGVEGGSLADKVGPRGMDLLRQMLNPRAAKRLSASECLASTVLQSLGAQCLLRAGQATSTRGADDIVDSEPLPFSNGCNSKSPSCGPDTESTVLDAPDDGQAVGAAERDQRAGNMPSTLDDCLEGRPRLEYMLQSPTDSFHPDDAKDIESSLVEQLEQHPCWTVPGGDALRSAWLPILTVGARSAAKAAPSLSTRAVPSHSVLSSLFSTGADAFLETTVEDNEVWLNTLITEPSPCGVLRIVLRAFRWIIDAAVVPRVAMCREWILSQQQRGDMTLIQAVNSVEAEVGLIDASIAARAATAARLLQLAYHIIQKSNLNLDSQSIVLSKHIMELTDSDAVMHEDSLSRTDRTDDIDAASAMEPSEGSEKTTRSDQGAGSDVGTRVQYGDFEANPDLIREINRGSVEERFHVRSVNEALAVVTPMLVDTEVEGQEKAKGIARLESLLGLPKLQLHAALLRPASKAALLYVALARQPAHRLNLVTTRSTAWVDCEDLLSRHTSYLDTVAARAIEYEGCIDQICKEIEEFRQSTEVFCESEVFEPIEDLYLYRNEREAVPKPRTVRALPSGAYNDTDCGNDPSLVLCPYYKAPFGQKFVEGQPVEEGEGLGPRKELFAILAETAKGNSIPAPEVPGSLMIAPGRDGDAPNVLRLVPVDTQNSTIQHVKTSFAQPNTNSPMPATSDASEPVLQAGCTLAIKMPKIELENTAGLEHCDRSQTTVIELLVEQILPSDSISRLTGAYIVRVSTSSNELNQLDLFQCRADLETDADGSRDTKDARIYRLFGLLVGAYASIRMRIQPLLVQRQDLESLWLNPVLAKTAINARRLALLGFLMGSAVANQCQLPLELPPFLFKALGIAEDSPINLAPVRSNQEGERTCRTKSLFPCLIADCLLVENPNGGFSTDEGTLRLLDTSYANAAETLLALDDPGFEAVMAMDGLNINQLVEDEVVKAMRWIDLSLCDSRSLATNARAAYAKRSALARCCELEWQLQAIRGGFERAMPHHVRQCVCPSARDLQRIICGAPEDTGDFKFREIFRIVMDAELRDCGPLHDALWAVVDGDNDQGPLDSNAGFEHSPNNQNSVDQPEVRNQLTAAQRRKLLKFITGVSRLPARQTEFMTIELPFLPFGVDEQRRMLAMIPQSHTCDNILELPNYWEALLNTRFPDEEPPRRGTPTSDKLESELRSILYEKFVVAIDNAEGYGLDALDPQVVSVAIASAAGSDDGPNEATHSFVRGHVVGDYTFVDNDHNEASSSIPELDCASVTDDSPRKGVVGDLNFEGESIQPPLTISVELDHKAVANAHEGTSGDVSKLSIGERTKTRTLDSSATRHVTPEAAPASMMKTIIDNASSASDQLYRQEDQKLSNATTSIDRDYDDSDDDDYGWEDFESLEFPE